MLTDEQTMSDFFHQVIDQVRDAVMVMTLGGKLVYVNRAATELYGYEAAEFLTLHVQDLRDPDTLSILPAQLEKAIAAGILFECNHRKKDGTTFPVEVSSRKMLLDSIPYLVSIIRDVSDRVNTKQELQFSQKVFELFLEYSPIYVFLKDDRIHSVFLSKNFSDLLGRPVADALDKPMEDLFPAEMAKKMIEDDKRVLLEGKPCEAVEEFNGKTYHTRKFPIFINGKAAYVAGFTIDITEQKILENNLLEKNLQLQSVIQMLPDLFYFKDMDRRYTLVNKALEEFLGLSADKILGKTSEEILPEKWAAQIRKSDDEAFFLGDLTRQEQEVDGQVHRWLDSFKIPMRNARGEMTGLIGGSRDITARKNNELMLKERTNDLEQSLLRLQKSWHQTIEVLASTSEAKDPYTAGHQKRVMQLSLAIGREMEIGEADLTGLQMAALIHDIGKIKVPGELLSKPGTLTVLEKQLIDTHAVAGYEIIKGLDLPWNVAEVVKQHHERYDGTGYPEGINGNAIALNARIVAVADVVEAMASHRPYRPALGIEAALAEIERGAGTLYDPKVSSACLFAFRSKGFVFETT